MLEVLYILAIIFFISIGNGTILAIVLMNLGIIHIPSKHLWLNAIIFVKKKRKEAYEL